MADREILSPEDVIISSDMIAEAERLWSRSGVVDEVSGADMLVIGEIYRAMFFVHLQELKTAAI